MGSRQNGSPAEGDEVVIKSGYKSKSDSFHHEYEQFLDDFEKPTAIYRLIRTTFLSNPRFLYRNLSYMEKRDKRPQRIRRSKFDINTLLIRAQKREEEEVFAKTQISKTLPEYVNIIVFRFCDGQKWIHATQAKVEIQLIKISSTRRKTEDCMSLDRAFNGSCYIPVKSQEEDSVYKEFALDVPRGKYPVVPVPKDSFNLVNGHVVQSIRLAIRVSIPQSCLVTKDETKINGIENVGTEKYGTKVNGRVSGNGVSLRKINGAEADRDEPKNKRHRSTKDRENIVQPSKGKTESIVYTGVVSIFDKYKNINMLCDENGDLEVKLTVCETNRPSISQKRCRREGSWEVSLSPDHQKVVDYVKKEKFGAKIALAFRPADGKINAPELLTTPIKQYVCTNEDSLEEEKENVRIVYNFLRNCSMKQATECRNDFTCPWCSINCMVLYSLLKHLEMCHPRFNFQFSRIANGAKVEVSINESFDGSYTGSAFDLVSQPPGQAFGRFVPPSKRTQVFQFHAFKPKMLKREKNSLDEFFNKDEKTSEQGRSYMIGHNRLYHHTTTCLPIHPREIDVDSEGEHDPDWLKVKTCMMIDEFTDVNEGEKEIMKMWNHHVMKDNYVGDCQIALASTRFVDRYGPRIIEKNLYRNFILHLTSLFDFGLLPATGFHTAVQALHTQMKENNSVNNLKQSWALKPLSTNASQSTAVLNNDGVEAQPVHRSKPESRSSSVTNGNEKRLMLQLRSLDA